MDVQISPPQDNINPMLPVQPRSLDDPHALNLPSSGGHLDIQGMDYDSDNGSDSSDQVEDVPSHEQSSSAGCLNIQLMDCTNGSDSSDSVEQVEDELLCNSLVSLIVDPPTLDNTSVQSFSSSLEVSTHTHTHACIHTHTHACMHACTHTHACMHACTHTQTCTRIHTHEHTHTGHPHTNTHRHTHTRTYTQTHRHTHAHARTQKQAHTQHTYTHNTQKHTHKVW